MTKFLGAAAFAALIASMGPALYAAPVAIESGPQAAVTARIDVEPAEGAVFAGAALRFHARVIGGTAAAENIRWEAFGAGTIDDAGLFHAPPSPGFTASIVATLAGSAGGARVSVVGPPPSGLAQAIVACYGDGTLEVRGAYREAALGRLLVGDMAGDVALGADETFAVATAGERLIAIDLSTMKTSASPPMTGARLGDVALLAGDAYAAATNENAGNADGGIVVYRLRGGAAPQLASTAAAGETPEGIAVDADGRTLYVAAVNSNLVTRLVLGADGIVRKTGAARTGTRPFGIAVDPRRRMLFVADNDTPTLSGTRSRPGLETFALPSMRRVGDSVSTGSSNALPLGVAVDASIDRLFVTNEGDDDVGVYRLPSLRREATLRVGRTPWLPSVDSLRHVLYVPNARDDTLDVFDTRTLAHVAAGVPTCNYPVAVAVQAARRSK